MIKEGAHVNTCRADGRTPLIVNSAAGNKEVVQELIQQKANVDVQDYDGLSALMVASQNGNTEIVHCLTTAGAIPDLKSKKVKKCTPLYN